MPIVCGFLALSLAAGKAVEPPLEPVAVLGRRAEAAIARGELESAERILLEALRRLEEPPGRPGPERARLLEQLAQVLAGRGRYREAASRLAELRALLDPELAPQRQAELLRRQARLLHLAGETARAEALLLEARSAGERAADPADLAATLKGMADIARDRGDLDQAARLLRQALGFLEAAYGECHAALLPALDALRTLAVEQREEALARDLARRAADCALQLASPDAPRRRAELEQRP